MMLLTQYLLKTDLFKKFQSMLKIEDYSLTNILHSFCLESDFHIYNEINCPIYQAGDLATHFYLVLKGKVSLHKPVEEKRLMSQLEYLDYLKTEIQGKDKFILEKIIYSNNNFISVNKFEEITEIKNILIREGTQDLKHNFSLYQMKKIAELGVFKEFGNKDLENIDSGIKGLENKFTKRTETIITETEKTILLAIDKSIYIEKIFKELNNYKTKETKFLNDNFFLNDISRFNFGKIFQYFKYHEFKKGDVIISEKNNKDNHFYFLREGILDITINMSLIELIKLIKNLISRQENLMNDFSDDIDLDMKSQPENHIEEFKKKKNLHLFRLTTSDCIGLEQIYYKKNDLYNVTVNSETAKLYSLSIDDLKKILLLNKRSYNNFNIYIQIKMKNLIKRLINCKYMIIKKIDTDGIHNIQRSMNSLSNIYSNSNIFLSKLQNTNFKINKENLSYYNNQNINFEKKDKIDNDILRAKTSHKNYTENNNIYNNLKEQKFSSSEKKNILNNPNNKNKNKLNLNNPKNLSDANLIDNNNPNKKRNYTAKIFKKRKDLGEIKKYKIIEDEEGLNIFYKNHKSVRDLSKQNDKLFTLLNSGNNYKIPKIEKIIDEEVEKKNKPLSELRKEKINNKIKKNEDNTSEKKLDNNINKTIITNKKIDTSSNLNLNSEQKNILSLEKNVKDKFKIDSDFKMKTTNYYNEKNLLESPKNKNFQPVNCDDLLNYNYNFNEIYGNPILSPSYSINNHKNFKNLENILKNERLDIIISKTKNNNYIKYNKKFDFGFNYNYDNFINNNNSFGNHYINDSNNIIESPINIFNFSIKGFNKPLNLIDFSSNNIKKYTLKNRNPENHNPNSNIIINTNNGKESENIKKIESKSSSNLNKIEVLENLNLEENLEFQANKVIKNNQEIKIFEENKDNEKLMKIYNEDLSLDLLNSNDQNNNFNKENIDENVKLSLNGNQVNKQEHNKAFDTNTKNENSSNLKIQTKSDLDVNYLEAFKRIDSLDRSNNIKVLRPVSLKNSEKYRNYDSVNNTTNQSNLENITNFHFNSNNNEFMSSKKNQETQGIASILQTPKSENINQFNQTVQFLINNKNNKVDKEILTNITNSNKLINFQNHNLTNNPIINANNKITKEKIIATNNVFNYNYNVESFNNYKNNEMIANKYKKKDKYSNLNFSNSILNNKIMTNFNNDFKVINNSNKVEIRKIDCNPKNLNIKNKLNFEIETNLPDLMTSKISNGPDLKKINDLNSQRFGLSTVKVNKNNFLNTSEKFNNQDKFKYYNTLSFKNGKKENTHNNLGNTNLKINADNKHLNNALEVKKISAKI